MARVEGTSTSSYWLTRFCFQRALGAVYLIAFLIAANQYIPLLGEHGLLPVKLFLPRATFWEAPSFFWISHSDSFITTAIWSGLGLSVLAVTGLSERWGIWLSMTVWTLLWVIYLSLVNVGQVFYGFGWETILLESGFLAIFLGSSDVKPPRIVLWLLLWVLFRIMFGAGMIKMRGNPCWRDLTCLYYHYETQPLPNPLSWYFHHLPPWWHKTCVLFTHFVELIVPWFLFAPWRRIRAAAGLLTIYFQFTLIVSGNLSWLNYVTIALCIPCFDDAMLSWVFRVRHAEPTYSPLAHRIAVYVLLAVVLVLSIQPAMNLFSREQAMNASFEPLHLVNTYGAFGSITRERYEIIIEGTDSDTPTDDAPWREYEFKGKPGQSTPASVHRVAVPLEARLANVVRGDVGLSLPPVDHQSRRQAVAERQTRAEPARQQSIPPQTAEVCPRRVVSVSFHRFPRRWRVVETRTRRPLSSPAVPGE